MKKHVFISNFLAINLLLIGQFPFSLPANSQDATVNTSENSPQNNQQEFLAVLDLEAKGGLSPDEASLISDRLRANLLKTGKYRILERAKMTEILKEQGFQQSALCDTSSCTVELGRLLAVNRIISGSVGKVGGTYTMSIRMLDVEKGTVLKEEYIDCKQCQLDDVLTVVAAKLAVKMAGQQGSVEVNEPSNQNTAKPEPTPVPIPKVGLLNISSNPVGLDVFVNGKRMGITPFRQNLPVGVYKISLTSQVLSSHDYVPQNFEIEVTDNKEVTKSIELELNESGRYKMYKSEERSLPIAIGTSIVPGLQLGYLTQGEWFWWLGMAIVPISGVVGLNVMRDISQKGAEHFLTQLKEATPQDSMRPFWTERIGEEAQAAKNYETAMIATLLVATLAGGIHSSIITMNHNEEIRKKYNLTPEDIVRIESRLKTTIFYDAPSLNGFYFNPFGNTNVGFKHSF